MKLAYRYTFRELLGPMLFGVAAFVSILVAGRPLQDMMKLAFQGVDAGLLVRLFLLMLPPLVVLTLPMSMLLATLLGFGRMSGDSETVAMFAGGVSLYQLAAPVVVLALAVMALTITLNEKVTPWSIDEAQRMRDQIEGTVGDQNNVAVELPQYAGDQVTARVFAQAYIPRTKTLERVWFVEMRDGAPTTIGWAREARPPALKRGETKSMKWQLREGWVQNVGPDAQNRPRLAFTTWDLTIQQPPSEIQAAGKKTDQMSMAQLRQRIGSLLREGRGSETGEFEVAWWNRLAMPFACVVFALIGLPLGMRPQRTSGGLGLGLSIVIIFLYWVVWYYTGNLGAKGILPPFVASWMANFLGIGIGVALLVRAPK